MTPQPSDISKRPVSLGAEALIGVETRVLDHGLIMLVDYMGTDNEIVQSARVTQGASAKPLHDDRGLLRYMYRHAHSTPFEMCELRIKQRLPIFVARQVIRHRTAVVNEMSLRYSEPLDCMYVPQLEAVCFQSDSNKQGRSGPLPSDLAQEVRQLIAAHEDDCEVLYRRLAGEFGVAKELARSVLPVALYTEWMWKIDLKNLLGFLTLRLDAHAQLETRLYGEAIAQIVKAWVPLTWEAFEDYQLHARKFSRMELIVLGRLIQSGVGSEINDHDIGWGKRERDEFLAKLTYMTGATFIAPHENAIKKIVRDELAAQISAGVSEVATPGKW